MKELLDKFKEDLEIKHQSLVYLSYVKDFLNYTKEYNADIYKISKEDLNNFLATKKGLSSSGMNNYIKAIKRFYKFLGIDNPVFEIIQLKVEQKIPIYITTEELKSLISYGTTYLGKLINPIKLKATLCFLFYTGARRGEFLNLKREDINLEENYITIRLPTKGKTERVVPFPRKIGQYLERYFKMEEETINAFNITEDQLVHLIEDRLNEFIKKHITIHTFRHSFAMNLARNGIDIRVAQKLLGHSDIKTTAIYYNPDTEMIKQLYKEKIKGI